MSWSISEETGAANGFADGGFDTAATRFTNADGGYGADGESGVVNGGDTRACRVCQATDHLARECPTKPASNCFKCGEAGHMKAECPHPGEGSTGKCKNCLEEGHQTLECKNPRKFDLSGVEAKDPEEAWKALLEADKDSDLDLVREAVKIYTKAVPETTYDSLEISFRSNKMNTHLIAKEVELANTWTIVNLQGALDQKYKVGYFLSGKPRRRNQAEGWPTSSAENLERLKAAGIPMDRMVIRCIRCNELGHSAKNCSEDTPESTDRVEVKCALCSELGHRVRDCTQPRQKPMDCKNCGETGHFAKECPNPPKGVQCRNCLEEGHKASECTNERHPDTIVCRNCDAKGHLSKDCKEKKDWSRVKCTNCEEMGHGAKRCPQPKKEEADEGGFDTSGGGAGLDVPADIGFGTSGGGDGFKTGADNFGGGFATGVTVSSGEGEGQAW